MVAETTFWAVAGAGGMLVMLLGGAIYHNRRMINAIKHSLFGTDLDDADAGTIIEMRDDIKSLREQMEQDHSDTMDAIQDQEAE